MKRVDVLLRNRKPNNGESFPCACAFLIYSSDIRVRWRKHSNRAFQIERHDSCRSWINRWNSWNSIDDLEMNATCLPFFCSLRRKHLVFVRKMFEDENWKWIYASRNRRFIENRKQRNDSTFQLASFEQLLNALMFTEWKSRYRFSIPMSFIILLFDSFYLFFPATLSAHYDGDWALNGWQLTSRAKVVIGQ